MTRAGKESPIKLKRKMSVTLGPIQHGLVHFAVDPLLKFNKPNTFVEEDSQPFFFIY